MLMIVPAMIWLARTEIDSQAWTAAIATDTASAQPSAMSRVGVTPKNALGADPRIGPSQTPTTHPVKAAASIVPSIPMLTTPDRSHSTPHRAPRASGVADRRMIGAIGGTIAIR